MIIAQLSDPHISQPDTEFEALYKTADKLNSAINTINRLKYKPTAVVISGDLINCGQKEEYEQLKPLLSALDMPCYLGIGNHDCRETFRECFSHFDYVPKAGFIQYAIDQNDLRMVMLDTNIPGKPQGLLCTDRLDWLDQTLSEKPETPTILFMHHPPFMTGITAMDQMGLLEAENFGKVVQKHDQVIRIFCGHLHRSIQSDFLGKIAQVCPSTSHRVMLALEGDETLATTSEPPELLLHVWEKNKLVTHSAATQDFKILWELEGDLY